MRWKSLYVMSNHPIGDKRNNQPWQRGQRTDLGFLSYRQDLLSAKTSYARNFMKQRWRLTKFVINLPFGSLWCFSQILGKHLTGQPRAIRDGELVLNITEPAVAPSRWYGDQEPAKDIVEELQRLNFDKACDNSTHGLLMLQYARNLRHTCHQAPQHIEKLQFWRLEGLNASKAGGLPWSGCRGWQFVRSEPDVDKIRHLPNTAWSVSKADKIDKGK